MLFNTTNSLHAESKTRFAGFTGVCLTLTFVLFAASWMAAGRFAEGTNRGQSETSATQPSSSAAFSAGSEWNELPFFAAPPRENSRDPDAYADLQPSTARAVGESPVSEIEQIHRKVSSRYGNPVVARFVQSVSGEQSVRLYYEASQLIDARHLEPATYDARVRQAMKNLAVAVDNAEFQAANRLSPSRGQIDTFRRELARLFSSRPVRSFNDALQMLYGSMDLAGRTVGLKPTAVAVEFVNASTESLDTYSAFVPAEQTRRPSADLEDHVVGIGVEIEPHEKGMLVRKVLPGGPAAKADLRRGDILITANGQSLAGKNLDFAVDVITGPIGSRLLLGVERDGQTLSPVTLTRSRVEIHSVSEVRMIEGTTTGYIKLDKFAQSSSDEMDRALWNLYRQGMKSLVFDLRGNPGGLLTTAIELSDKFLPRGTIVSTHGRTAEDEMAEYATFEQTWKIPLVVLVDGNSASASEIFAAAIQENERGLVVGSRSYGKGTVQTHFPLQTVNGNLRLTTAKFYSPKGREMAGAGVEPDVAVTFAGTGLPSASDLDLVLERGVEVAKSQRLTDLALANSTRQSRGQTELQRLGG